MNCGLCGNEVDPHAPDTWKQVKGWVGGPRKDSMRLREDTGEYAHNVCVQRMHDGLPANQPTLFDDTDEVVVVKMKPVDEEADLW